MTVVAYCGRTIAIDRQATLCETRSRTKKWRRMKNGTLVLLSGTIVRALAIAHWLETGARASRWPYQEHEEAEENFARVLVLKPGEPLLQYENDPHAMAVEDPFYAWGSGGDIAIGALAMGASATQAVEVASQFNVNCGHGVDAFDIKDGSQLPTRGGKTHEVHRITAAERSAAVRRPDRARYAEY